MDMIKYNMLGQIERVVTVSNAADTIHNISLSYVGNKIVLNTPYFDTYELDDEGRVIVHTAVHREVTFDYINKEEYQYDKDGYLNKVTLKGNEKPYSIINYDV